MAQWIGVYSSLSLFELTIETKYYRIGVRILACGVESWASSFTIHCSRSVRLSCMKEYLTSDFSITLSSRYSDSHG